jgi:intein/homing endonuclease
MSFTNKPKPGSGIASLLREAGRKAQLEAEKKATAGVDQLLAEMDPTSLTVPARKKPHVPHIFSVIDYIEADWGLQMKLFPVQRFIVKLYYNLPLDTREKTITITDKFNTRVDYKFTEMEYLHFLYNEGRCNINNQDQDRRQLILAIGRRGGKCCAHGTICLTSDGLRPIEELGDPNGPEFQPLKIRVAQEGRRQADSAYFYVGGHRKTIRFRTHCGYELEGTPNHRVKVMGKDGSIQWRRLDEVHEGDQVGVHRKTNLWAKSYVDLTHLGAGLEGRKSIVVPTQLTEQWGELIGVLVGDGSWNRPTHTEVTVGPYPEWLAQVVALFTVCFGVSPHVRTEKSQRAFRVRFFSTAIRTFLDRLGYTLNVASDEKRIPWSILRSPKSVVAAFLRGLFETDGGMESGRKVSFSTASRRLAHELQIVLLNFGIVSRVKARLNRRYGKTYYHLTLIGADSVRVFARDIGFLSERKSSILHAHLVKGDQGNKSDTEQIPHQREWVMRLLASVPKNNGNAACDKLGWCRSKLREALGNTCKPGSSEQLSYDRLRAALVVARDVGADPALIRHFEELIEADYFYDPVVEIQHGEGKVYDLTVPDGESFVANGLTNHNTTLSSLFASYEVYRLLNLHNPQGYYGLPGGNTIQIISVATDKDQAGILFREVSGHLSRCEYFRPYILTNTLSRIDFQTPADIEKFGPIQRMQDGKFASLNGKSSIRVTFRSAVAKGLRGMGNIVVILDEMAHFIEDGSTSAAEVYNAVTPSTAAFSAKDPDDSTIPIGDVESRIICISSPLNKQGKFYDLYQTAMGNGEGATNMIAIQAPTWEINPTVPAVYYKQKFYEDPAVFMTEHGAEFSDRVRGWIERAEDLLACIDPELRPKESGAPRSPHQMGVDVAVTNDGTSVAITHVEDDEIILDYHEVWYAGVDWRESNPHLGNTPTTPYAKRLADVDRLDFEEIAVWIDTLCRRFHITEGIFDRWEGLSLEQQLHKRGLKQFTSEFFNRDLSSKMYQAMKLLMFDQKIRLYDFPLTATADEQKGKHSGLIAELLSLQATQLSKNLIQVEAPQTSGCHDDMSDALVRSVWLSMKSIGKRAAYGMQNRPHVSGGATVGAYQLARARRHGGFTQRVVPKNLGLRGRPR